MPKNLKIAELIDIYGNLLNEKQKTAAEGYYYYDMSLSEIAENTGISRQGVRETIKRAESILMQYEDVLQILKKRKNAEEIIEQNISDKEKISLLYNNLTEDINVSETLRKSKKSETEEIK